MIYTPGKVPETWRPGLGKMIKAGSDLVLQIRYTTHGKETEDHTQVGRNMRPKEKPTERAVTDRRQQFEDLNFPPGRCELSRGSEQRVPQRRNPPEFLPHMHLRGKAFEYRLVYPDRKDGVC